MTRTSRLRPLARAVLRTQSDERLVALVREGREAAFEEIVRRYRPGLVAFAAAYAPPDRIEDVVQESLVRSWQALGQATEEIHLKPWLYTIVRNRALNARRDAKLHEPLSEQIDGVPQPPEIVLDREELDSVVSAVGALPQPQREALVRSALEGHTHEQIAAALGSSPGAVRQLIYRARLSLRTGVGMLIPLPLVRMLSEHGAETTAAGVAVGGAAIGAAGSTSALSKVAIVALAGTVAAGAGVAIDRSGGDRPSRSVVEQRSDPTGSAGASQQSGTTPASTDSSGPGSGDDSPAGSGDDSGPGSDDSGPGSDDSGSGSDDSGPSPDSDDDQDDRDGSDSSGPGPGDDDPPEADDDDNSGPGGDGGNSGPGGGGEDPIEIDDDDNSGPGSGSSGSGSGESGSGSGSARSGSGSSGSGSSGSGSSEELYDGELD